MYAEMESLFLFSCTRLTDLFNAEYVNRLHRGGGLSEGSKTKNIEVDGGEGRRVGLVEGWGQ